MNPITLSEEDSKAYNHLLRYLGSITILSFGEPGSQGKEFWSLPSLKQA